MSREIVMGIDVGTFAVKTVIVEKRKDDTLPYVLGAGISKSYGLRRGYIVNPNDVAIAVKDSVKKSQEASGLDIKHAFVSIGGAGLHAARSQGSILVSRADHKISDNDLKRALNQSENQLSRTSSSYLINRDILHFFPLSYKIDGEMVLGNPIGMKGEKLEVETLFITCLSQHINNLIKSMNLAGITIEDIVAKPWAMAHGPLNRQEKEVGSLLINIGADTSSIIIFEEGIPVSLEVFPIGSNHITYDIAQGFQVLLDEAEQLKISYGADASTKRKLNTIVEPRLIDIFELVDGHLNKINRAGLLPGGIILTGGGANLWNIEETAKRSLNLPVHTSCPKFLKDSKNPIANPVWSTALGLCLMALKEKEGSSDEIPKGLSRKAKNTLLKWFKTLLP